jgi:bidirectional [NiFe] hydrogenase diaphorase subunit
MLTAHCLGSCGLAPVSVLDGQYIARATPESLVAQVRAAIATTDATASAAAPARTTAP